MKNILKYKKRFYMLMESELGDVKPISEKNSEYIYALHESQKGSSEEKMKIFIYKYCSLKSKLDREPSREEFTKTVQKSVMGTLPTISYNIGYQVTDQDWEYLQNINCDSQETKEKIIGLKTADISAEIVRAAQGSVFDPTWEDEMVSAVKKIDDSEEFQIINDIIKDQTKMDFDQLINDELGLLDGKYVKIMIGHLNGIGVSCDSPSLDRNEAFKGDFRLL